MYWCWFVIATNVPYYWKMLATGETGCGVCENSLYYLCESDLFKTKQKHKQTKKPLLTLHPVILHVPTYFSAILYSPVQISSKIKSWYTHCPKFLLSFSFESTVIRLLLLNQRSVLNHHSSGKHSYNRSLLPWTHSSHGFQYTSLPVFSSYLYGSPAQSPL